MALTATPIPGLGDAASIIAEGSIWAVHFGLAFTGSYVGGGEGFNPLALWPGGPVPAGLIAVLFSGGGGNQLEFIAATNKIKIYTTSNTEVGAVTYASIGLNPNVNVVARVMAR